MNKREYTTCNIYLNKHKMHFIINFCPDYKYSGFSPDI